MLSADEGAPARETGVSDAFQETFAGRSVFVTGHTGFKGSWLSLWLERLGARVFGYALEPPTVPDNFTICQIQKSLADHTIADVRDAVALETALRRAAPDVVFHLAAQSVVRESYAMPRETFEVNVIGIASLLDAIRNIGRPCVVVVVTSDKCYLNVEQVWGYRENDRLGDLTPYGASKSAAEILISSYRHSYFPPRKVDDHGVKLASGRAGNVIGGGDWTGDALIVDIVRSVSRDEVVPVRNPQAHRPWQHVIQALSGYMILAKRLLESDDPTLCSGWNFGPLPGDELSVAEVVDGFLAEWGEGSWRDERDDTGPYEAGVLRLNIEKAFWELGWRPCWDIDRALKETVRWYRRYFEDPGDMRDLSLEQIALYEATLSEVEE